MCFSLRVVYALRCGGGLPDVCYWLCVVFVAVWCPSYVVCCVLFVVICCVLLVVVRRVLCAVVCCRVVCVLFVVYHSLYGVVCVYVCVV